MDRLRFKKSLIACLTIEDFVRYSFLANAVNSSYISESTRIKRMLSFLSFPIGFLLICGFAEFLVHGIARILEVCISFRDVGIVIIGNIRGAGAGI